MANMNLHNSGTNTDVVIEPLCGAEFVLNADNTSGLFGNPGSITAQMLIDAAVAQGVTYSDGTALSATNSKIVGGEVDLKPRNGDGEIYSFVTNTATTKNFDQSHPDLKLNKGAGGVIDLDGGGNAEINYQFKAVDIIGGVAFIKVIFCEIVSAAQPLAISEDNGTATIAGAPKVFTPQTEPSRDTQAPIAEYEVKETENATASITPAGVGTITPINSGDYSATWTAKDSNEVESNKATYKGKAT
jgi:hypothetical protein